MRLLQLNLRTLLLYSLALVVISIPVAFFSINSILNEEVDESLALHSEEFIKHIKTFEYLDDLEMDLEIWDQLSYDIEVEPLKDQRVEKQFQTVTLYDSVEHELRPYRMLYLSVNIKNKPYLLTIRRSLVDNDELVMVLATVQIALVLILAVSLLLVNRSLTRKLWQPFYTTLSQLKAYEVDKSESITPEKTDIIEFDDLNKTVSHLTDRNRKVFLEQKEFIENASHELQTPLAIFQSKLDLLMQMPITEAAAGVIAELEETAQRMSRLNKNLFLLSKIDNDQYSHLEELDVSVVATSLLTNLKPMAAMENINIRSELEPTVISANRALMEILVTNLFHNAIRHTPGNGQVSIVVKDRSLIISNNGEALKNPDRIFDRFVKESNNEKSTGLGLAIVKKICDTCQYQLRYEYRAGLHTFSVIF